MTPPNSLVSGLLACAVMVGICVSTVAKAETVGEVKAVGVYAYGTPPGNKRAPKWVRDDVYFGEHLETIRTGSMKVVFDDESELFLGSKSSLIIDEFVFDPAGGKQSSVINLTFGVFRFVSGKMDKQGVQLVTPLALIGIRGTDFTVQVNEDGGSIVSVKEGEVDVTSRLSGEKLVVVAGQVAAVSAEDGGIAPAEPTEAPDDAGVTDHGVGRDPSGGGGGGGSTGGGSTGGGGGGGGFH